MGPLPLNLSVKLIEDKEGNKTLQGTTGIEKSLDRILGGQDGVVTYEKDRNGNIVPGSDKVAVKTEDGKDVYTTLSAELQTYLGCFPRKGKR